MRPVAAGFELREHAGDRVALRIRIAILLARADYVAALANHALEAAEASRDAYVLVQVLNILGAVHFDRATSQLSEPYARAHLTSLDPGVIEPMEVEARRAFALFERALAVAVRARYEFAAWYVAGNIERLEILLGNSAGAVRANKKAPHGLAEEGGEI